VGGIAFKVSWWIHGGAASARRISALIESAGARTNFTTLAAVGIILTPGDKFPMAVASAEGTGFL
jgi:hypothetical protein